MFSMLFNSTTLSCVLLAMYLYYTGTQMYKLMNPMDGVEVSGPTIDPLWSMNQSFTLITFLSHSSRFSRFYQRGLHFLPNETKHETMLNITMHPSVISNGSSQVGVASTRVWKGIRGNSTDIYLHALAIQDSDDLPDEITGSIVQSGRAQYGVVKMIKLDTIPRSFRHRYLLADLGWQTEDPEDARRAAMPPDTIIPYWKPEVAVRLVTDFTLYPLDYVPPAMHQYIVTPKSMSKKKAVASRQQLFYRPPIHADEIGLTSDKYIPLNASVTSLPLTISYEPMSMQRWLLMRHMEQSFQTNKGMGFTDNDLDDVRRLISDTSIYLLGVTMFASTMHLLFEFLAFQSDISFWQQNKSLAGLSVRAVITDLVSQIIVFLFLLDSNTSLLVIIPAFCGIVIQCWKVKKATGVTIRGWSIVFTRLESVSNSSAASTQSTSSVKGSSSPDKEDDKEGVLSELTRVTIEADRYATTHLGAILLPLVIGFAIRSLVMDKHASWYSWVITTLTTCVYTGGFVLMCPQLFINHKLKSVSHLPWKFLCFRFINTFIDDLFAFIIKMPTMHRLSVFRDDIVFIIYMYQRYIYRVDESRPIEK